MVNQQVKNVLESMKSFNKKEDGTYNITTKKSVEYTDGFQVSFVRPEAFEQLNPQDWDNITNYFCEYFKSIAHIGVYCSDTEVSFHSISCEKALNTMVEYNQESILDWKNKHNYPDLMENWFIINRFYKEDRVINYEKILSKIH